MTTLTEILEYKRKEIARQKQRCPLSTLQKKLKTLPSNRRLFLEKVRQQVETHHIAIIAELKKASPSCGIIQKNFHPEEIAKAYTQGGATALSVLTDRHFFKGAPQYISAVKKASPLPVLRKDFILDDYQIYESKYLGADAILLIVAALDDEELKRFYKLAQELECDVLIEVHNEEELTRILPLKAPLVGINNRDLHTFRVDLNTTLRLLPNIPQSTIVMSESGIERAEDIQTLSSGGVYAFLVGEALMKTQNPEGLLKKWLRDVPRLRV
ncbi:MAG: indole-3-glycerol phosphate synthase TrpC [Gammaproteobacteria bacterium]|nr:indole-3-glycerol phosphate synthase TrpC [Gammaproteobacteria bacterium]